VFALCAVSYYVGQFITYLIELAVTAPCLWRPLCILPTHLHHGEWFGPAAHVVGFFIAFILASIVRGMIRSRWRSNNR
jgi:biotin transporter BioY